MSHVIPLDNFAKPTTPSEFFKTTKFVKFVISGKKQFKCPSDFETLCFTMTLEIFICSMCKFDSNNSEAKKNQMVDHILLKKVSCKNK